MTYSYEDVSTPDRAIDNVNIGELDQINEEDEDVEETLPKSSGVNALAATEVCVCKEEICKCIDVFGGKLLRKTSFDSEEEKKSETTRQGSR